MKTLDAGLAFAVALSLCRPAGAQPSAFETLTEAAGPSGADPLPEPEAAASGIELEAFQYLPPDSGEPGFEWPGASKSGGGDFVTIGGLPTYLKASAAGSESLGFGSGKCALDSGARYELAAKPGFEGAHMTVSLRERIPGCGLDRGYIYLPHVACSSAGGACELPKTVRAFLDTIAYAEGTRESYNYIFTFATFQSYADHPRVRKCAGRLCSTAAGRYQYLSTTWDGLAGQMGLSDFTPPSQDRAVMELIRRLGAYGDVLNSSNYDQFTRAVKRLNRTWASLPGSPYGQPTHQMSALWRYYRAALDRY